MQYKKDTSYPAGGDVNQSIPGKQGRPQSKSSVDFTGVPFPTPKQNSAGPSTGEPDHGPLKAR